MRNLQIVLATIISTLAMTGAAFADTSAYNKYTTTNTYGGYSETNVDAQIDSHETVTTNSTTTKVEAIADLGTSNFATVNYNHGQFSANATSSNNAPVDPVATIYVSTVNQNSVKSVDESATIDTFNSYQFSGTSFEHEVGNRF
jgi:hypothetical protein